MIQSGNIVLIVERRLNMTKANIIPCDFNIAFYKVMGEVKYDDYHDSVLVVSGIKTERKSLIMINKKNCYGYINKITYLYWR